MTVLPPEIHAQIVLHSPASTLPALSRTSRAFQVASESVLYHDLILRDAQTAFSACLALVARQGERGAYVRKFWFFQRINRINTLPERFWQAIQEALIVMVNLETLLLYDPAFTNTWILRSPDIKFQLREANLGLQWDNNLVDFLQTQERLTFLHAEDSLEDGPLAPIAPGKLQTLRHLQAPALVVSELLACPLTHLQIDVEQETAAVVPTIVTDVGRIIKGLRSLHIVFLPEAISLEIFQLVSTSVYAPSLQFLGALPYPVQDRHEVHRCLMRLYSLRFIELDVSSWLPQPYESYQRMLAAELRTFCPSLTYVGFWIGNHHFCWVHQDDEWTSTHANARAPIHEMLWRNPALVK